MLQTRNDIICAQNTNAKYIDAKTSTTSEYYSLSDLSDFTHSVYSSNCSWSSSFTKFDSLDEGVLPVVPCLLPVHDTINSKVESNARKSLTITDISEIYRKSAVANFSDNGVLPNSYKQHKEELLYNYDPHFELINVKRSFPFNKIQLSIFTRACRYDSH